MKTPLYADIVNPGQIGMLAGGVGKKLYSTTIIQFSLEGKLQSELDLPVGGAGPRDAACISIFSAPSAYENCFIRLTKICAVEEVKELSPKLQISSFPNRVLFGER